jgi:3-oxoacyl-(acyl-carrier-protein) synthase
MSSAEKVRITAAEVMCGLGNSLTEAAQAMAAGHSALRPDERFGGIYTSRIPERQPLRGRRYGVASNAAVHVARRAALQAGWTQADLSAAWILAGSSRGNIAEQGASERRAHPAFSASNTLHSEIPAAVSIALGIHGPWQMFSNGCASSLDALGWAWQAVSSGWAERVLVVGSEFPLTPSIVTGFRLSRVLNPGAPVHPYAADTAGMCLGEAAVALTVEKSTRGTPIQAYAACSDAHHTVAMPPQPEHFRRLLANLPAAAHCPHATGTAECREAENYLRQALGPEKPVWLAKPWLGHTLGASGALEIAFLCHYYLQGLLPPNLGQNQPQILPTTSPSVCKWASSMGGHHAAILLG